MKPRKLQSSSSLQCSSSQTCSPCVSRHSFGAQCQTRSSHSDCEACRSRFLRGNAYHAVLSLKKGEWSVDKLDQLPEGVQPQITPDELLACEEIVRKDPTVRGLAKEVGVEPHQICCHGWAIGYDERFPQAKRIQQGLMFARFCEHDNLYAHPLDFIPIVDSKFYTSVSRSKHCHGLSRVMVFPSQRQLHLRWARLKSPWQPQTGNASAPHSSPLISCRTSWRRRKKFQTRRPCSRVARLENACRTDRRWTIVNRARQHYSSGRDVGYQIVTKSGATPFIPRPDSWVAKRAKFPAQEHVGIGDDSGTVRMWPAGKYVPQTRGPPADSVGNWVNGAQKVDNEDILLFITIGTTHLPRPEDWPVWIWPRIEGIRRL